MHRFDSMLDGSMFMRPLRINNLLSSLFYLGYWAYLDCPAHAYLVNSQFFLPKRMRRKCVSSIVSACA